MNIIVIIIYLSTQKWVIGAPIYDAAGDYFMNILQSLSLIKIAARVSAFCIWPIHHCMDIRSIFTSRC